MNILKLSPTAKMTEWLTTVNSIIEYLKNLPSLFTTKDELSSIQSRIEALEEKHQHQNKLLIKKADIDTMTKANNVNLQNIKTTNNEIINIKKNMDVSISSLKENINSYIDTQVSSLREDLQKYSDVNASMSNKVEEIKTKLIDFIYPIGSIYMSMDELHPDVKFGGIWDRITDRYIIGAGRVYQVGSIGGEDSHTLSIEEMPSHKHNISLTEEGKHAHKPGTLTGQYRCYKEDANGEYVGAIEHHIGESGEMALRGSVKIMAGKTEETGSHTHTATLEETGNGNSFSILPPYIAINIWKRVA